MFNSSTKINTIVSEDLRVWYDVNDRADKYVVARHATMRFSVVDLSKAAAASVRSELTAQFTRHYSRVTIRNGVLSHTSIPVLAADTDISRAGPAYVITVGIEELDEKVASLRPQDPATLFTEENERRYTYEESNNLEILRVARNSGGVISITPKIIGDDRAFLDNAVIQYKLSDTENSWKSVFMAFGKPERVRVPHFWTWRFPEHEGYDDVMWFDTEVPYTELDGSLYRLAFGNKTSNVVQYHLS